MKKFFTAALAASALLLCCASCKTKSANVTFDQNNYNLAGNWFIEKVDTTLLSVGPEEEWPHLEFNTESNQVNGMVGCNQAMGSFSYNDKGSLSFGDLATTMMMCPQIELESLILKAVPEVKSYSINNVTGEMKLSNADGQVVMVLSRVNPRELLKYKQSY